MWLDGQRPWRILWAEERPWLEPSTPFECRGLVPDVVFPTGLVELGDRVLVYYGAADSATAVAEAGAEVLRVPGTPGQR